MLEIDRLSDAGFRRKQFLGAARWRSKKRHLSARSGGGNSADERQMPDDVADAGFHLDDCSRRHIDCRAKGCDMPVVLNLIA